MKKTYKFVSIAVLTVAMLVMAVLTGQALPMPPTDAAAGQAAETPVSGQALTHREWVWVPGVATQVNWFADKTKLDASTSPSKGEYYLGLMAGADNAEVSVPVELRGGRRYVNTVKLCSWGFNNNARVDSISLYNGRNLVASASGLSMNFDGYRENTFHFGQYRLIDRGLTVVLYLDNWDTANSNSFRVSSVGVETRW